MLSINFARMFLSTFAVVALVHLSQPVSVTSHAVANRAQRDTLLEWPAYSLFEPDGPGTYSFGYEIDDPSTGNRQYRQEERSRSGVVKGSFGILNADGTITTTNYISDLNGYRPSITKQKSNQEYHNPGSDVRLRPSSNLNYARKTTHSYPAARGWNVKNSQAHPKFSLPSPEKTILFAHPTLYLSDNIPIRNTHSIFDKNYKLSSLFFTDEYLDNIRGTYRPDDAHLMLHNQ